MFFTKTAAVVSFRQLTDCLSQWVSGAGLKMDQFEIMGVCIQYTANALPRFSVSNYEEVRHSCSFHSHEDMEGSFTQSHSVAYSVTETMITKMIWPH